MPALWFAIVSGMLATYFVLDGFDFGVGILHRAVARTDQERKIVLSAIGPVYDGNEVWLIAAGGVLFMAFPSVYSTAFSGFYLALMIVLWLLILRGVAIEFRTHQDNPLWCEFWDTIFSVASILLAVVFGASLGNLVRGVPLGKDGLSGMPLFTNFLTGKQPGIFDWYTTLVGLFALAALAGHGALYLAWKTSGPIHQRSLTYAQKAWWIVLATWIAVTLATAWVQPSIFTNLIARPWSFLFVILSLGGFGAIFHFLRQGRELPAFLSSCLFLFGSLGATMAGIYPLWLRSTIDPSFSLSATNTASAAYGLRVALVWWIVGITLTIGYFVNMFRSIRGKVPTASHGQAGID